jgi:hypothetical protein
MPARRSALEVSFPDVAEELREEEEEEEEAETGFPGRPTSAPLSARKDTKRKKANSLVDSRVSRLHFRKEPLVVMGARLRLV